MGGVVMLAEPWLRLAGGCGTAEVDLGGAPREIDGVEKLRHRGGIEVGIAEVARAIREHPLLDLRQQVHVLRRVERQARKRGGEIRLHRQHREERDATGARQRGGDDVVACPVALERSAPQRAIGCEVGTRDVTMVARHLGEDEIRGAAGVEPSRAPGRYPPQCGLELRLTEGGIGGECAEVSEEVGAPVQCGSECIAPRDQQGTHPEALVRVADRGGEIGAPREPPEAVMQLPEARHRPGHRRGAGADRARVGNELAGRIDVHAGARARGRTLPVVEEVGPAVDEHGGEATAAEITRLRVGYRESEADPDCGVDRVPTGGEYLGRRVGAVAIGRGDGGARSIAAGCGRGRRRRRSVRRGDRKQQGNALQGVVAVTIHSAPGSGTVSPTWRRASAARIDSVAAALSDAGWPSSARLAGPMLRAVSSAASSPRPRLKSNDRSNDLSLGRGLDAALDTALNMGPASRALDGQPASLRAAATESIRAALARRQVGETVPLPGALWIVTATTP